MLRPILEGDAFNIVSLLRKSLVWTLNIQDAERIRREHGSARSFGRCMTFFEEDTIDPQLV